MSPDRRGTGAAEIAAVVAADKAVQQEREARWSYLQGAYRDPHAATATLDELVKSQGWTSAAARTVADPLQLGELRGKEGLFAGAKARAEREAAQRAAGAIGPSLERIGEAESRGAELPHGRGRPAYGGRDRRTAPIHRSRGSDRRRGRGTGREGARYGLAGRAGGRACRGRAAVLWCRRRAAVWGVEGVHAILRVGGRPSVVTAPSVAPEQRLELDRVAKLTATMKAGERASATLTQREAESQRQTQRRGMRM